MHKIKIHLIVLAILLATGFAVFANGLSNGFMIDDHAFFDAKMRNIKYLPYQFLPDKNAVLGIGDRQGDAYYRPIAHVLPMLSYWAFGDNLVGHHALNIVLWSIAAWMVFVFIYALFQSVPLAFVTAFLYLIHPINGIVVNYITASVFAAQIIFMMSALLCFVAGPRSRILNFVSILFFVPALMCHESAMALPFYVVALLFLGLQQKWQDVIKSSAPLWIFLVVYFIWRLKFASLAHSILGNYPTYKMNIIEYLMTAGKLIWWYVAKLFYPVGIIMIKAENIIREGGGVWLLVLAAVVGVWGWLMWRVRSNAPALLGLVWFGIGFLPFGFATLFRPSHGMMIEPHWFVFPVLGFFLWVASLINIFIQSKNKFILGAVAVMTLCLGYVSIQMNRVWGNEVGYCKYWLEESPGFAAPTFYLAKAYELNKAYVPARHWYEEALKLNYKPETIYTNLGLIDIIERRFDDAKVHLKKSLEIDPYIMTAISNLGTIAFIEKDYEGALGYFKKATTLDRFAELPRLNAGKCLYKLGRKEEAIQAFEDLLAIVPREDLALKELLEIYVKDGNKDKALTTIRRILGVSTNPRILAQAGMTAQHLGETKISGQIYELLMRVAPPGSKAALRASNAAISIPVEE